MVQVLTRLKIHTLHGNSRSFPLLHPFCCFYPVLSPHVSPQLPLLHHLPLSVALLFIAMSSQGSAATKAFSCCHYNYSLHTSTHTHACTHNRSVFVSARVCTLACAVKKRLSYFYLSPSSPSTQPPTHPLLHPSLPPATFAMLCTGGISSVELEHPSSTCELFSA